MSVDLFSRVRGAGNFHYKGIDLWTKDVGQLDLDQKPFTIDSDAFGPIARRGGGRLFTAMFTPVGVWTAAQLAVLFPYLNPRIGDFNTPVRNVTAVDHTTDLITAPTHGYLTGTGVRMGGSKTTVFTMPTGLAVNTTYYVIAVDANTLQLAATEALAVAGTALAFTDNGTGTFFLIQNSPLTVTTVDGFQLALYNAAIVGMPDLTIHSLVSTMKAVKFEGYTLHGMKWSDANSLFNVTSGAIGAVPPDQSQIPSVAGSIDWATRLPVTAANTGTGKLTIANHGLLTGQSFTLDTISSDGVLPAPLVAGTTYYAIVADASNIEVATTNANAMANTAIALTSVGAGKFDVIGNAIAQGIENREGVDVSFPVTWGDVAQSSDSIVCRSITRVDAKVSFTPTNLAYATLLNALALQGGSAAQGQDLPSANLDLYGPGWNPFIRIYNAQLDGLPARFGASADRVDKLNFTQQRGFRGTAALPIASVGVAAPTI